MRSILYGVIPHFYALLAARRRPELAGSPVILLEKDTVFDVCPEASQWGVKPGMSRRRARQIAPGAAFLPYEGTSFSSELDAVREAAATLTPVVEPEDAPSVYLDLTGCGDPADLARRYGLSVYDALGLPLRLGLATSKLVAKVAATGEHPPAFSGSRDGFSLSSVPSGHEEALLAGLPIDVLPLEAPVLAHLAHLGLHSVGDIVKTPEIALTRQLGPLAQRVAALSRGLDNRPVLPLYPPDTLEVVRSFPEGLTDYTGLRLAIAELCLLMRRKLDENNRVAGRLTLAAENPAGTLTTGYWPKVGLTGWDDPLAGAVARLFKGLDLDKPVLRLVLTAERLVRPQARQLTMFPADTIDSGTALHDTLRTVRQRFGPQSIALGKTIGPPRREKLLSLFDSC